MQLKQRQVTRRHVIGLLDKVAVCAEGQSKGEAVGAMARCRELLLRHLRCLVDEVALLRDVVEEEAWLRGAFEREAEQAGT